MDITKNIMNYISQEKTDYAIMIEGEWGCGKTYFVKNILFPKINKEYGNDKYKLIYISLFGIRNINDISKKILMQYWTPKSSQIKSKKSETISEIGKVILSNSEVLFGKSFDLGEIEFTKLTNTDNIILFFDDLERATVDISEVLGYINNFVEHDNIKTIIISSEKVLSTKANDTFNLIKEKLIAKTITYSSNPEEIINSLIAEQSIGSSSSNDILNQNKELILQLLDHSPVHNYRIIRQFVNDFNDIYSFYSNSFKEDIDRLTAILIETTLILSIEIKANLTDKSFFEKFNSVKSFISSIPLEGNNTFTQINSRYFTKPEQSLFFMPSIYHYIISGQLNTDEIQRDRDDFITYNAKVSYTPYEKICDMPWYNLSDSEFESALSDTYTLITSGNLPLNYYFKAFQQFKFYSKYSLLSNLHSEFYKGFISGLEKIDTIVSTNTRDVIEQMNMQKSFIDGDDFDEQTKKIEEKIIEVCSKLQLIELQNSSKLILDYLKEDMNKLEKLLVENFETPIFNAIEIPDLVTILKSIPNSKIRQFNNMLIRRYDGSSRIKNLETLFIDNYISYIEKNPQFLIDINVSNSLLLILMNHFKKINGTK